MEDEQAEELLEGGHPRDTHLVFGGKHCDPTEPPPARLHPGSHCSGLYLQRDEYGGPEIRGLEGDGEQTKRLPLGVGYVALSPTLFFSLQPPKRLAER